MSNKKKRGRSVEDRLKDVQHEILVAVASGMPLADVMSLVCTRAEEIAPNAICSIIRVDSGGRLRPLAAPSLPESYSQSIDGLAIGPMVGSCGSAAYLGEVVEVTSIRKDPRWAPYRAAALSIGLKACWSTPIKSHDDRVVGAFAFYFRVARRANRTEKRIVERCLHLCALAIEHWTANARVRRLAYADPLTGLGNRALLAEKVPAILEQARARDKQVAVYLIDIDGFRTVNDTRGNQTGDWLLCRIADRMRFLSSGADLVARLGGDEFLIIETERDDPAEFEVTARRLEKTLADRYTEETGAELRIAASVGVACFPHDGATLDALMAQADTALRGLRSTGKSGCAFYTASLDAEKRAQRLLEQDIAGAAAAGQLSHSRRQWCPRHARMETRAAC